MTEIINIKDWSVEVACDLYVAGITEDGWNHEAEMYFITVTSPTGKVLAHDKVWKTSEMEIHDEGGGFITFTDEREEMLKHAESLVEKIKEHGEINCLNWRDHRPVYGSEQYIVSGAEEKMLRQEMAVDLYENA